MTQGRFYVKPYYVRGVLKGYRVYDGETNKPVKNGKFLGLTGLHLANTLRDDLNANVE